MASKLMAFLARWYLQYELITCIYMFEPWERIFLHSTVIALASLVCYSSYTYLPTYTLSLWENAMSWNT